jgi:feruloyl-CoA synthase
VSPPEKTGYRDVRIGPPDLEFDRRPDGVIYVRSPFPLGPHPATMTVPIDRWAREKPEETFLAARATDGSWTALTWAGARAQARRIGQALAARGLSARRPIAILSGNDIEHALLGLGAMYAGIPYAPISPAYSLVSRDFGKLRAIFELLEPGLVFVSNGREYARALEAVLPESAELVVARDLLPGSIPFSALLAEEPGPELEAASAALGPDTIVKFLFTSGSTGTPKAVVNTQRMWTSNSEMARMHFAFVQDEPPVIIDWLPWNHTFGGNADVGLVLYTGGTLYIDQGKPAPGLVETSIENLRDVAPTIYLNVPKGFEALIPYLRRDPSLREHFFSRLRLLFYAGAGLSQHVWDALMDLAVETCGERIRMLTGLGSTETAPHALFSNVTADRPGLIGGPAPGVELKLVPFMGKLEARLRGPNITPGYWKQDALTREAFDEEGFYKLGDALRFVDEARPGLGFVFDGRIAEDFKLATGTWVSVGPLRGRFLAHAAPFVRDVVIAGHDRDWVGVLILPDLAACREACPGLPGTDREFLNSAPVRTLFRKLLEDFSASATGSSNRIRTAILLDEAPSIDAHEVTDKGSLNQRAVLDNRPSLVEALYDPIPRTLVIGPFPG